MTNLVVVKLGGSLLSRSEVDIFNFGYLSSLKATVMSEEFKLMKFFFAVGGGFTMRSYRDLARKAGVSNDNDLHWVGTTVNVLHAYLVKAFFSTDADEDVVKYEDYYSNEELFIQRKIKIGGGGRPGHSGDVDASLAARKLGANTIVSLKNVDGVYDRDPKLFKDAIRQKSLTWDEYLKIIGGKEKHEPGGNYPIYPIAARMAKDAGLKFVITAGDDLTNFANYLAGREYTGTEVS